MAKYKSRAKRASEVAQQFRSIAEQLRNVDESEEFDEAVKIEKANTLIQDVDFSEVESLTEEMQNWRDNMSGTNLESTNKYSEVDECASNLENIDCSIDEVEDVEEISGRADELEEKADELENCEFPSMY